MAHAPKADHILILTLLKPASHVDGLNCQPARSAAPARFAFGYCDYDAFERGAKLCVRCFNVAGRKRAESLREVIRCDLKSALFEFALYATAQR